MDILDTTLQDVKVLVPRVFPDDRGWFCETFSARRHAGAGIDHTRFVQENQSRSIHGVVRGLHTRSELREAKLVRCARGVVYDVAVDLRPWSPTFEQWEGFELDDRDNRQVLIPAGFAHGFQVVSDEADVCYKVDAYYDPSVQVAIAWDDPDLGVEWPLDHVVLSDKDRAAPPLRDVRPHLVEWFGSVRPPTVGADTFR